MKHVVISVYDTKVQKYHPPMVFSTLPESCRFFEALLRRTPDHPYTQFPADYIAYHVATWDDDVASFDVLQKPHAIGSLEQFVSARA